MNEDNNENDTPTNATSVVACVPGNTLHAVIGTVEDSNTQVCLGSVAVALGFLRGSN